MFSVLYDPYASQAYEAALRRPTFVSVQAAGKLQQDLATLSVEVNGDVAKDVFADGEQPRLTVYLMERDVFSDSQLFWTDEEKEETKGQYVHANVIREILSDPDGDEITNGGDFAKTYQTELDPSWQLESLYLVAFVHRGSKQGGKYMHVLNSCEGELDITVGVKDVEGKMQQGTDALFDLTGRKVRGTGHGIFILNGKKIIR